MYNHENETFKPMDQSDKNASGAKIAAARVCGMAVGSTAGAASPAHADLPSVEDVVELDNIVVESGHSDAENEGAIRYADVGGSGTTAYCRVANRNYSLPGYHEYYLCLRLVL